ncbi:MAG: TOBE domain-containing protein, partial [Vicinamibacterales bacterium]
GLRAQMRIEIGGLQRRLKTTTIYVTHDQVEAMTLGDRIVVLANGRIQQVGKPIELYRSPVNRFVAGFIGTPPMNFVDGRVQADDGRLAFVADGVRVLLSPDRAQAAMQSEALTLGIRPEDLKVVSDERLPADAPGPALAGQVLLVERLGGTSHVHCEVGPHRLMASVSIEQLPAIGDRVHLQVPPARVHLFGGDGRSLL